MRKIILPTAMLAALTLAGCATLPGGGFYGSPFGGLQQRTYPNAAGVYSPAQAQQEQRVQVGTVIAVQPVTIQTGRNRELAGEGIGAAAGGLLGNQIGSGKGQTLATIAGAIGGAVAGNSVAAHGYQQQGLQVTVKLDASGGIVAVTQQRGPTFTIGERVEIIGGGYGQVARVEPLGAAVPMPAD